MIWCPAWFTGEPPFTPVPPPPDDEWDWEALRGPDRAQPEVVRSQWVKVGSALVRVDMASNGTYSVGEVRP